MVRKNE